MYSYTKMAYLLLLVERARRRERVFRDRTQPLDIYDDVDMFKKYRFNRAGVTYLIDRLGGHLEHQTQRNHAVPPSLQVFVALRFFATGSVLDNSASHHGVSISSVSRIVRRVTEVLCDMKEEVNKLTTGTNKVKFNMKVTVSIYERINCRVL